MFQRRMFCSSQIPRSMYAALHIQSAKQATSMLPSLVSLPSQTRLIASGVSQTAMESIRGSQAALNTNVVLEDLIAVMMAELGSCASLWCKRNLSCLVQVPRISKVAL
ncbi:Hypothetical protein, putative [Bodo saltans]|uniref:Uncharacterized protein n=1 Tax=Bodo saltans TaxID=75058 RepID=A0A0S4KKW4_BODSA|nr:Hypothetical protein, putative [Bodo saltans]|eukprot:CUI14154.1 Hypothetical protein, putative [Bodo saltans]